MLYFPEHLILHLYQVNPVNNLENKNYFYDVCGYTLTALERAGKPILEKSINRFSKKD
jgi:hypothetical protein